MAWAPFIFIYQVVNRFPLRSPIELPFTRLDHAIPFVPELLPLYVGYIGYFWWTVARSEDDLQASRIWYATYLQLTISTVFFLLLPVRMPRELFYPPEAYGLADTFWRWFDEPNNCFPSLHVSNVLICMHFNATRARRGISTVLGIGIIASTVLVKQHYVVDVAGGALVYAVTRRFLERLTISRVSSRDAAGASTPSHSEI